VRQLGISKASNQENSQKQIFLGERDVTYTILN